MPSIPGLGLLALKLLASIGVINSMREWLAEAPIGENITNGISNWRKRT